MILTFLPAGGGLLRQGLVLVEVQVLGTTVVTLLLQDLLVLVLSVELPAHNNSFWSRAEKRLYSPQSGASQVQWLWAKRQLLRLQKLILYISILESFIKQFYKNHSKMYISPWN